MDAISSLTSSQSCNTAVPSSRLLRRRAISSRQAASTSSGVAIPSELSEPVEDPEEVRQAWVRLAVERLEKLERGEAKTVGWDEVQGRLQKILDR